MNVALYGFTRLLSFAVMAIAIEVTPINAAPLASSEAFDRLMACAAGFNISVQGEMLGSVKEIFDGKKTIADGFKFDSVAKFLSMMPENDKLEAYRLYIYCISPSGKGRAQTFGRRHIL